jgi:hypothetical protein
MLLSYSERRKKNGNEREANVPLRRERKKVVLQKMRRAKEAYGIPLSSV